MNMWDAGDTFNTASSFSSGERHGLLTNEERKMLKNVTLSTSVRIEYIEKEYQLKKRLIETKNRTGLEKNIQAHFDLKSIRDTHVPRVVRDFLQQREILDIENDKKTILEITQEFDKQIRILSTAAHDAFEILGEENKKEILTNSGFLEERFADASEKVKSVQEPTIEDVIVLTQIAVEKRAEYLAFQGVPVALSQNNKNSNQKNKLSILNETFEQLELCETEEIIKEKNREEKRNKTKKEAIVTLAEIARFIPENIDTNGFQEVLESERGQKSVCWIEYDSLKNVISIGLYYNDEYNVSHTAFAWLQDDNLICEDDEENITFQDWLYRLEEYINLEAKKVEVRKENANLLKPNLKSDVSEQQSTEGVDRTQETQKYEGYQGYTENPASLGYEKYDANKKYENGEKVEITKILTEKMTAYVRIDDGLKYTYSQIYDLPYKAQETKQFTAFSLDSQDINIHCIFNEKDKHLVNFLNENDVISVLGSVSKLEMSYDLEIDVDNLRVVNRIQEYDDLTTLKKYIEKLPKDIKGVEIKTDDKNKIIKVELKRASYGIFPHDFGIASVRGLSVDFYKYENTKDRKYAMLQKTKRIDMDEFFTKVYECVESNILANYSTLSQHEEIKNKQLSGLNTSLKNWNNAKNNTQEAHEQAIETIAKLGEKLSNIHGINVKKNLFRKVTEISMIDNPYLELGEKTVTRVVQDGLYCAEVREKCKDRPEIEHKQITLEEFIKSAKHIIEKNNKNNNSADYSRHASRAGQGK